MSTASDAETINNVAADPAPSMPTPLSTSIKLLRGLGEKHEDGTEVWHDVAEVRELTGADEEWLAALESKPGLTYTEYMNALLDRAVVRIGTLVVADLPGIMNKLILPDRDMLFLGVVRATYGVQRDVRALCPHCGASNDISIDLDEDFPVKKAPFDLRETIKVKLKNGTVQQLRLPNGADTVAAQKGTKTDAEINTVMLSRCAVFDDNEPADRMEWARGLNVGDRRKLINALLDLNGKIGPDLEGVDTQCATCGEDMPISLDWVSLLLS